MPMQARSGSRPDALRALLERPEIAVLPGVYDALGARIAQQTGFEAIFASGFGLAASMLGVPDIGLLGMSEMLERVRRIVRAVDVPVLADVDTGYGNPLNVARTVSECVDAGVAGIMIEDQEWPKKCGHFENKRVIPADEQVAKIRAAVDARGDSGLVIIGRTDARGPLGLEEAIRRARLYHEAGADLPFVEAPQSREEMQAVVDAFPPGTPLFMNLIEGGKGPFLTAPELQQIGYSMVIYSVSGLFSAAEAMKETYRALKATGTTDSRRDGMVEFHEFEDIVNAPGWLDIEARHAVR